MTDWSTEEAMTFVVTGGTNAPDKIRFANPRNAPDSNIGVKEKSAENPVTHSGKN